MVNLTHPEVFGPFEGSMFIGGAVEYVIPSLFVLLEIVSKYEA